MIYKQSGMLWFAAFLEFRLPSAGKMDGHLELSINPSGMVCDYKCSSSTCSKENYVNFVEVNSSKTFYPELKTYLDSINDISENESGFFRNANVPLKVECVECHGYTQ